MSRLFRLLVFKLIRSRNLISLPPLFYLSVAFALGIGMSQVSPSAFLPLLISAGIILFLMIFARTRIWFLPVSFCFFFVLGHLFGVNDRTLELRHIRLAAPEGRISLEGTVLSVPEIKKRGRKETISFVLGAKNFYRNGALYQTRGKVQVFLYNPGTEICYGDFLRLKGILEGPKTVSNPYVFDYGSYLAHQGIFNVFRGIGKFSVSKKKSGSKYEILSLANKLRTHLRDRILRLFPAPYSELASALILGFRKNIPDEIKEAFIKTGTAHLLAISGLNVSLIVALFYLVMSFFGLPRHFNLSLSILFILTYTALAGANPPVLRAGIMGCMVFGGYLLSQEHNIKSAFFLSFFALLTYDPSLLFSASFQLSFLAMASLLYILPKFSVSFVAEPLQDEWIERFGRFIQRSVAQSFLVSASAAIGMFPVLLWYFNLFSVISFLCNLIAIPLCTLSIASSLILLAIDSVFPPAASALAFVPLCVFRLNGLFILKLSEIPFGYFYLPPPGILFFIFYYSSLMIWIFCQKPKWIKTVSLSVLSLGTIFFLGSSALPSSRSVVFDLGQADAFYVSFSNGSKCLINTGRHFPSDQAYWVIRSFLMARAVHRLDGILLTQTNAAYAGGLKTLMSSFRTNRIFFADGADEHKKTKYIGYQKNIGILQEGSRIQFGSDHDRFLEILTLHKGQITSFSIRDRGLNMLYLLSEESAVFECLLQSGTSGFDYIYIAHHDVPMSEAEKRFLRQVTCRYMVINQRSRIQDFLSELQSLTDARLLFIRELGALEFISSSKGLSFKTYKSSQGTNLPYLVTT